MHGDCYCYASGRLSLAAGALAVFADDLGHLERCRIVSLFAQPPDHAFAVGDGAILVPLSFGSERWPLSLP